MDREAQRLTLTPPTESVAKRLECVRVSTGEPPLLISSSENPNVQGKDLALNYLSAASLSSVPTPGVLHNVAAVQPKTYCFKSK